MRGRRLPDCTFGKDCPDYDDIATGDYLLVQRGEIRELYFRDPTGGIGRVSKHTITEHEDGTISVSPSIVATKADHGHDWHGYLQRGVWSEA